MPAPRVTLTFDHARTELITDGWGKSYPSASLAPCAMSGEGLFERSSLGPDFWGEPNRKVLMLRPSFARLDFKVEAELLAGQMPLTDFGAATAFRAVPYRNTITLALGDSTTAWAPLTRPSPWSAELPSGAQWGLVSSDPLSTNEGFAVELLPYGVWSDRAAFNLSVSFGQRFVLRASLAGQLELRYNRGTAGTPDWATVWQGSTAGADPGHARPYMIGVVPFGESFLSINVNQPPGGDGGQKASGYARASRSSFCVDLSEFGAQGDWDSSINQFVKTPADNLGLAFASAGLRYRLNLHRVRYKVGSAASVQRFGPDRIGSGPINSVPQVRWLGYADYVDDDVTTAGAKPKIRVALLGRAGAAWDKTTDTEPVASVSMRASSNGRLSPEVWSVDVAIPAVTATPSWTPVDVSALWYQIEVKRTLRGGEGRMTARLYRDADYTNSFRRGGPVRLTVRDVNDAVTYQLFDGYVTSRERTLGGFPADGGARAYEEVLCNDMRERLRVPIGQFIASDYTTLGAYVTAAIGRAGFLVSEIDVDPLVDSVPTQGFEGSDALSAPNPETTVEELIVALAERYTVQGYALLSWRWTGTQWRVELPSLARNTARTYPETVLCLDEAPRVAAGRAGSDAARWTATTDAFGLTSRYLRCTGLFEVTSDAPEYNALGMTGSTDTGQGAERVAVVIDPHPDVLGDPTAYRFEGRLRFARVGAPGVVELGEEALARVARAQFQTAQHQAFAAQVRGEWQPGVDVGQEVMVAGSLGGSVVSYGAYRIEALDIELRQDHGSAQHEWSAVYSLSWLGPTAHPSWAMFSTVVPPQWGDF